MESNTAVFSRGCFECSFSLKDLFYHCSNFLDNAVIPQPLHVLKNNFEKNVLKNLK